MAVFNEEAQTGYNREPDAGRDVERGCLPSRLLGVV